MQGKLVNLTVHRNTREKRERRETWGKLQRDIKGVSRDIDGYALVTWSRDESDGSVVSNTAYRCADGFEATGIPSFVSEKLRRRINGNTGSE